MDLIETNGVRKYHTPVIGSRHHRRWTAPDVSTSHLQETRTDITEWKSWGRIKRRESSQEEVGGFQWN